MSRVFSISLNEVSFAKLGELQKKYSDLSRNAMINHIINVTHSGEFNTIEERNLLIEALRKQIEILKSK